MDFFQQIQGPNQDRCSRGSTFINKLINFTHSENKNSLYLLQILYSIKKTWTDGRQLMHKVYFEFEAKRSRENK